MPAAHAVPTGSPLILPLGLLVDTTDDGATQVRCGTRIHTLSVIEYAVWALAHGSAAAIRAQRASDRSSVLERAADRGLDDVAQSLDALLARGLLVEVADTTEAAQHFAERHTVTPLTPGVGNSAEDPSMFGLGLGGEAVIQLGFTEFDVWHWSATDDNLWQTCCAAAAAARRSQHDHPAVSPSATEGRVIDFAHTLLGRFLRVLPGLLITGTVYLDDQFRLGRPAADPATRDAA